MDKNSLPKDNTKTLWTAVSAVLAASIGLLGITALNQHYVTGWRSDPRLNFKLTREYVEQGVAIKECVVSYASIDKSNPLWSQLEGRVQVTYGKAYSPMRLDSTEVEWFLPKFYGSIQTGMQKYPTIEEVLRVEITSRGISTFYTSNRIAELDGEPRAGFDHALSMTNKVKTEICDPFLEVPYSEPGKPALRGYYPSSLEKYAKRLRL